MPDGHSTTGDQGRGARESIVAGSGRCMREPNDGPVDPCTGAPLAAAMLPIATTEAIRTAQQLLARHVAPRTLQATTKNAPKAVTPATSTPPKSKS